MRMRKSGAGAGVLPVILTALFLLWRIEDVHALEAEYRPVVFACVREDADSPAAWLLGGSGDGTWYGHTSLPILVNGRPVTPEEGIALDDPAVCSTPLLEKGQTLVWYSAAGNQIGTGAVKETRYFCSMASTESFIEVETDGPDLPVRTLCLALGGNWNAIAEPTFRTLEKDRLTFSVGLDAAKTTATFFPAVDEYGELIYRGTITYDEKTWPLTDASADSPDHPEGVFIDLNGDGRAEFVLYSPGIAGFVAAWDLTEEGALEIMTLDLGD